jgi:hypothetical protein
VKIAFELLCGFYAAIAAGSASGKFSRNRRVLATMRAAGVKDSWVPWLGTLELLGALGIVAGIWWPAIGVAAAVGLTAFFVGAVLAHARVKDQWPAMMPPFVLVILGAASTYLEVKR